MKVSEIYTCVENQGIDSLRQTLRKLLAIALLVMFNVRQVKTIGVSLNCMLGDEIQ